MNECKINIIDDTYHIQFLSLTFFMKEVGYVFSNKGFFHKVNNDCKRISFNTAVELYNNAEYIMHEINNLYHSTYVISDSFPPVRYETVHPITFPEGCWENAMASRIVEKVKLQVIKKNKKIIVLDNRVKFINEEKAKYYGF